MGKSWIILTTKTKHQPYKSNLSENEAHHEPQIVVELLTEAPLTIEWAHELSHELLNSAHERTKPFPKETPQKETWQCEDCACVRACMCVCVCVTECVSESVYAKWHPSGDCCFVDLDDIVDRQDASKPLGRTYCLLSVLSVERMLLLVDGCYVVRFLSPEEYSTKPVLSHSHIITYHTFSVPRWTWYVSYYKNICSESNLVGAGFCAG